MPIHIPVVSIVVNSFKGILLNDKIDTIIFDIKNNILKVYKDIGQAHFNAAQDALMSAKKSIQKRTEINSAINHLREAYFINLQLLEKKETINESFLFGLFKDSYEVDVINKYQLSDFSIGLCDTATLISLCYGEIYDLSSAKTWKERALQHYNKFLEQITADIDEKYMESKGYYYYEREERLTNGRAVETYYTTVRYVNNEGQKYIEQQNLKKQEEMRNEFLKGFKKMKIH